MNQPQPCMGGWCNKRIHCPHYQSRSWAKPAERLCWKGADGVGIEQQIVLRVPQSAWHPQAEAA